MKHLSEIFSPRIQSLAFLTAMVLVPLALSVNAEEISSDSGDSATKKTITRFKNTPIPDQGNTHLCAGFAAFLAVEQSLGVKFESLEEVLDAAQMIDAQYDRKGLAPTSPHHIASAYGLVRESYNATAYELNKGLSKIEECVAKQNIAMVLLLRPGNAKHIVCITEHRTNGAGQEEYLVHDSATGKAIWESKEIIKEQAEAYHSRGVIAAYLIDCSQRVTGNSPVSLPESIYLSESIHSGDFCKELDEAVTKQKTASENEMISTISPDCLNGSILVNLARFWKGENNQNSVPSISRILRSNLLAQRKVCASINYKDDQGKEAFRFGTLIGADSKGFFFKVDDQTIHILEKDLVTALSEPVLGYIGSRKKPNTPQRNLLLVYPRDSEGKAIVGIRKTDDMPSTDSTE